MRSTPRSVAKRTKRVKRLRGEGKIVNNFIVDLNNHLHSKVQQNKISYNTAKNCMTEFRKYFETRDSIKLDREALINHAKNLKDKRKISSFKKSIEYFCTMEKVEFDVGFFDRVTRTKDNKRSTKWEKFELGKTLRRINKIDNKSYKLAYRLTFAAGLRISETAALRKDDIEFLKDNKIKICIRKSKGKNYPVDQLTMEDPFLYDELKDYISQMKENENLFYKTNTLEVKASKIGFMPHDLRRAYAQIIFSENKHLGYEMAVEETKEALRHSDKNNIYKKYLSRNIDYTGTRWNKLIKKPIKAHLRGLHYQISRKKQKEGDN